jgi:hypothetical protein
MGSKGTIGVNFIMFSPFLLYFDANTSILKLAPGYRKKPSTLLWLKSHGYYVVLLILVLFKMGKIII